MNQTIQQLIDQRTSCRAFKPDPVDTSLIQSIFASAQHSPSNCNVQPWHTYVASGETLTVLKNALVPEIMSGKQPAPEFDWNPKYEGVHKDRQWGSAMALYDAMGIAREDKQSRMMAMGRNWMFFDAPHVVFFTMQKYLGIMGAVDLGIYAQTVSMLFTDNGIDHCFQGALGQFPGPIKSTLSIPDDVGILFGMSFGYADPDHPANQAKTDRAAMSDAVSYFT